MVEVVWWQQWEWWNNKTDIVKTDQQWELGDVLHWPTLPVHEISELSEVDKKLTTFPSMNIGPAKIKWWLFSPGALDLYEDDMMFGYMRRSSPLAENAPYVVVFSLGGDASSIESLKNDQDLYNMALACNKELINEKTKQKTPEVPLDRVPLDDRKEYMALLYCKKYLWESTRELWLSYGRSDLTDTVWLFYSEDTWTIVMRPKTIPEDERLVW